MKKLLLTGIVVLLALTLNAQNVTIPDANFKAYLVGNTAINTNMDAEIQVSEANAFTGMIDCHNMSITSLTGIEQFTAVTVIVCYTNQLTSVDLSNNVALTTFNCAFNQFTSLDFSNNPALTTLSCSYNQLTYLNIANGNNASISYLETDPNTNLTCIQVDDVSYSTTNWTSGNYIVGAGTSYSTNCPCTVNIPDANFKAYLVGNTSINTNMDTEIQCSEATAFTGTINCFNMSISNLTGIEAFTNINSLQCNNNQITAIDISNNTSLTSFECGNNLLTSLDVNNNPILAYFYCQGNQLTSIDVTNNPALNFLHCYGNQLTSLNLSNNPALINLNIDNNFITSLDISNCPNIAQIQCQFNDLTSFIKGTNNLLTTFYATDNEFTTIDLSNLPALYTASVNNANLTSINVQNSSNLAYLYVSGNALTNIDLSTNVNLESFYAGSNEFTSLDFSGHVDLHELILNDNLLTSLNFANGNNSNIGTNYFKANNNPNLTCIEVDDVAYSTTNWTFVDPGASFSLDCASSTSIKENAFIELSVFPNPASDVITVTSDAQIEEISVFDTYGNLVNTFSSSSFSVSHLSSGIYFLNITTANGIAQGKFIKE